MMASIIPVLEYDIFISYRHNDNRSGWVTEFVNKKKILAFQLFDVLQLPGKKPPFDLSATPCFARRLKQVGIVVP